jgi:hypothetical protein
MKKIYMILAGLCIAAGLQAQNLDPTVEVSRAYEGKLIEVRKPAIEMSVPDTLYKFDLGFDYSVFENPYRGSYEFNPYMMDMRPESNLQKPSQFYMRAGAGYTLHPVFDLLWSPDFKGAFSMDVYGMHKSYIGAYRPVMGATGYKGYDLLSNVGVDLGYDWDRTSLDFGASYYGVAVKDFSGDRAYNAVDAYCSIGSKKPWAEGFLYNVGVAYRYSDDVSALPLKGHELGLDVTFGPSFGDGNKVFFDLGMDMNAYSGTLQTSLARFYLVPHYVYDKGILHLDLGFRLSAAKISANDVRNQVIYPAVKMSVAVIPDAMRLYMNVGGGEKLNTYSSLVARNHHVGLGYLAPDKTLADYSGDETSDVNYSGLMQPSMERVSAELGLEGRISSFFSYNLKGGYANNADALMDGVVAVSDGVYRPCVGYSSYQSAFASLDWDLNFRSIRFDGGVKYTHCWGYEQNMFAPSVLTGDVEVLYNWRRRIYAGADCVFASARGNSEGLKVPGYADLGVYGEYAMNDKISFWLRGGNLLNMEVQKTFFYAEKGINFTAGICLNF